MFRVRELKLASWALVSWAVVKKLSRENSFRERSLREHLFREHPFPEHTQKTRFVSKLTDLVSKCAYEFAQQYNEFRWQIFLTHIWNIGFLLRTRQKLEQNPYLAFFTGFCPGKSVSHANFFCHVRAHYFSHTHLFDFNGLEDKLSLLDRAFRYIMSNRVTLNILSFVLKLQKKDLLSK